MPSSVILLSSVNAPMFRKIYTIRKYNYKCNTLCADSSDSRSGAVGNGKEGTLSIPIAFIWSTMCSIGVRLTSGSECCAKLSLNTAELKSR